MVKCWILNKGHYVFEVISSKKRPRFLWEAGVSVCPEGLLKKALEFFDEPFQLSEQPCEGYDHEQNNYLFSHLNCRSRWSCRITDKARLGYALSDWIFALDYLAFRSLALSLLALGSEIVIGFSALGVL